MEATEDLRGFINHNFDLKGVLAIYGQEVYENCPDLHDNFNQDQVVATFIQELLEGDWE